MIALTDRVARGSGDTSTRAHHPNSTNSLLWRDTVAIGGTALTFGKLSCPVSSLILLLFPVFHVIVTFTVTFQMPWIWGFRFQFWLKVRLQSSVSTVSQLTHSRLRVGSWRQVEGKGTREEARLGICRWILTIAAAINPPLYLVYVNRNGHTKLQEITYCDCLFADAFLEVWLLTGLRILEHTSIVVTCTDQGVGTLRWSLIFTTSQAHEFGQFVKFSLRVLICKVGRIVISTSDCNRVN